MFAEVLDEGARRQLFDDLPPRLLSKPFFGALNWVTVWYRPRRLQTDEEIKTIVERARGVCHARRSKRGLTCSRRRGNPILTTSGTRWRRGRATVSKRSSATPCVVSSPTSASAAATTARSSKRPVSIRATSRLLEDLRALPLTKKTDYVRDLAANPPFGSFRAVDVDDAVRVHYSSGTTARPAPVLWTQWDIDRWSDLYARYLYAQGVRREDVFQCLFSYAWFVGGLGATAGYTRLGATVLPAGSADTERQVDTIFRFGTTSVGGTPSFVLHIAEAAERLGRPLRESQVRHVMVGGEPGGAVDGTRALVEEQWGARCFDGYGCLEFQPIAWECDLQVGGRLAEDFIYVEILDPATQRAGRRRRAGVLVLTHLDKEACPLVRWWTGDIVVRDSSIGPGGRSHARLAGGVLGRADDMLIRGVNVFPSAVEDVVRAIRARPANT